MNFKNYQREAQRTDQQKKLDGNEKDRLTIPLLGLAGEAGTLLSEFKKRFRDQDSYELFRPFLKEELGDILWYVSNIATVMKFDMDEIAKENIRKTRERWPGKNAAAKPARFYDERLSAKEQLPRELTLKFEEKKIDGQVKVIISSLDGKQFGNTLDDNFPEDDGYRYHDAFHLSYAAILGWSPMVRKLLDKKRKSNKQMDRIQDGARAAILEEAIAVMVYAKAKEQDYFKKVPVDNGLLKTIRGMVTGFEVQSRTYSDWSLAITEGLKVFTQLRHHKGGKVTINMRKRSIVFSPW